MSIFLWIALHFQKFCYLLVHHAPHHTTVKLMITIQIWGVMQMGAQWVNMTSSTISNQSSQIGKMALSVVFLFLNCISQPHAMPGKTIHTMPKYSGWGTFILYYHQWIFEDFTHMASFCGMPLNCYFLLYNFL